MDVLAMRPCGACMAYVPETGCPHWRPLISANASSHPRALAGRVAQDRARQEAVQRVAEFRRAMRL